MLCNCGDGMWCMGSGAGEYGQQVLRHVCVRRGQSTSSARGRVISLQLEDRCAADEKLLPHRDMPGRQALDDQFGVQSGDGEVPDLDLVIRPKTHAALLDPLQPEGALDPRCRFLVPPVEA